MLTTTITPRKFYKELRANNFGLRHAWSLVRVLKHYGHCYITYNGEKALFLKAEVK